MNRCEEKKETRVHDEEEEEERVRSLLSAYVRMQ